MPEIKYFKGDEDLNEIKYKKIDWDVNVKGISYQILRIPEYVHTIGGKLDWGDGNCFWAYPIEKEMSVKNLVAFNGIPGARWGFEYVPINYIKTKWGDTEILSGRKLVITRNDEVFYDGLMCIHEAISYVLDNRLDEHPLELNDRDFDKKCVGRKVWYRSEPGIITRYVNHQGCVIIEPDRSLIDKFTYPKEYQTKDGRTEYEDDFIKADIFSDRIYWFR